MSRSYHPLVVCLLFLLVFFASAMALLQFRLTSSSIERVEVQLDSQALRHPLDLLLANNLVHLSRSNTFDQLFVPQRQLELQPWAMQTCQVSQAQFNDFAQWQQFSDAGRWFAHPDEPADTNYASLFLNHRLLGRLDAPASGINFYQAYAYCKAAGGRLPGSDEWEAAASGQEGRIYPWGNQFIGSPWRFRNPLLNASASCNQHPKTNTPEGLADMGGGVSEWAIDEDGAPVLRGGNGLNRPYALHALNLVAKQVPADFSSQFVGFRCAFDPGQAQRVTPWRASIATATLPGGEYQLGTPEQAIVPRLATQLGNSLANLRPLLSKQDRQGGALEASKYEISVAQYAGFLRDPLVHLGLFANTAEPNGHSYQPDNWRQQLLHPRHPVVGISWWGAYAFANWAGGRLPSLDEWNWLFGGGQARLYPWGNNYSQGLALVRDTQPRSSPGKLTDSRDVAPTGLIGMAGNVSEWTSSLYLANGQQTMVIKGGNFLLEGEEAARLDYIAHAPAYYRSSALGFRVVFD